VRVWVVEAWYGRHVVLNALQTHANDSCGGGDSYEKGG
jgi:hypothetical protein